ncbi:peptidoglycan-recognition protein SC2-like [Mytilus californianus]|uniref:peptidoglycan-recognition protein SC2-like n=1 Tax=Mytilus californianus TaxID=6549 RepID=UPI002246241A|nr:peptidoglycan-recognition protein SC2-like [Mytilus californianus]
MTSMSKMLCLILLLTITGCSLASDQPCLDLGGHCQYDSNRCIGSYYSGNCAGSANRRCCIVDGDGDQPCIYLGGHCQDDSNRCGGSYYSGKCTGSATRRCCTRTAVEHDTGDCANVNIISRDSWGARRPGSTSTIYTPVPDFFIHHTTGGACTSFSACIAQMKGIQNYHMDDSNHRWADIGYSFLVGEDGKIYEGRGWDQEGAHTLGYNSRGLAASFMGNFSTHAPNSAALNAVKELIQCGISKGKISQSYALFGHRDVSSSACPGTALYNVIKTWARFKAHSP